MATDALVLINEKGRHSNEIINDMISKYSRIDGRDRALFVKLIHGTLEYQIQIDYIINLYSKIKIEKMKPYIRNLLRMSVYQLLYLDKIPDNSICDEAVKLIKKTAFNGLAGFVNGVLRTIARESDSIVINDPCLTYSVKEWMYDLLVDTVGKLKAEEFLAYSLNEHGVSARIVGTDNVFVLDDPSETIVSDKWTNGELIIQDYSSTLPVVLADIKPGQVVIDVCASPGGKSIQASEKVGENGTVISCDISDNKITKIRDNIERLKVTNIRTCIQDATVRNADFIRYADVVIADCPCSGIGTISKKPEIKTRLSLDDCITLSGIQLSILSNVSDYVKDGGKLVYSTCTLDHFENEDNVRKFLFDHSDFYLLEEKVMVPYENNEMPFDGFYIAVMEKKCLI